MTAHTHQPLRRPTATQARPLTFQETRAQLGALHAATAAGIRQAADLNARLDRFEEATKPRIKTRDDVYAEFVEAARRRFAELPEQEAISMFLGTPAGYTLHRAYMAAPPAPVTATDPLTGRSERYRAVNAAIDQAATELRTADPSLSHAEAVDRALERDSQLFAEYQVARREDRSMRSA